MNKRIPPLVLISIMLVFPTASTILATEIENKTVKKPFLLSFNSYIDLEYDPELLNTDLPIDEAVTIPITINYWTDIPENFLWFTPWTLRNWILFGNIIAPMQKIHLGIIDNPDWATIYFSEPNIFVNIPAGNDEIEVETSLFIGIHSDAPAEKYTLGLKAETPSLKRINGFSYQENMDFTPRYVPIIQIFPAESTVITPPNQITFVPINITNFGNAETLVTSEIITELEDWSNSIIPPQVVLSVDETEQMTLVLMPPEYFEGMQQIKLSFTPSRYPVAEPGEVGPPINISIIAYYIIR